MKALSVDDRDENLYFLETVLRSVGFDVVNAHNGIEALELLDQQDFDLIVSDVLMPRMDGFQLCHEVRQRVRLKRIPFVFYSGSYTDPKDAELARRLGATRYLLKPMEPLTLAQTLKEIHEQATQFPTPAPASLEDDENFLKAYNERLTQKLCDKVAEYERLSRRLQEAFDDKVRGVKDKLDIEQTMQRNEEQYRAVVESLAEGIILVNQLGLVMGSNASAAKILGLSQKTLAKGHTHTELWTMFDEDGSEIPAAQQPLSRALAGAERTERLVVGLRCEGAHFVWLSLTASPCQVDEQGRVTLAVMSFTDVTEQRANQQQLRSQANIIDQSTDAIIVCDEDAVVRYWNKGAEKLYGWTSEEAVGKKEWQLFARAHLPYLSPYKKVMERGSFEAEFRHVTKSHRELIVQGRFTAIERRKGEVATVLAFYYDITGKKQLEEQFLRAQRLESIGVLAGGVAHDLNNILAPILLAIPVLRMRMNEKPGVAMLDTMEASATRGAQIVRQILTFSRGLRTERTCLQARHLLKEIAEITQETFPRNIAIETDLPRSLWMVNADSTQLHQVVMNLCVNARDAMHRGGTLTLRCENVELDAEGAAKIAGARPGKFVRISVEDTGTGIAPELLPRLFEPFFTTKEIGKGTGLGLSTVHSIVTQHDGFAAIHSVVGEGSRFEVYLPAVEEVEEEDAEAEQGSPKGSGELVLVIDDEFALRHICESLLTAHDYRVITADNGQQGLAQLRTHQTEVALIITDLQMPGMTGAELIPLARGLKPTAKIIAVSGTVAAKSDTCNPPGVLADAFLPKPFAAAQLLKTVHEVLADGRKH